VPIALSERNPRVSPQDVLGALVPPPTFADVRLETYRPDPAEPSQQRAVTTVAEFASRVTEAAADGRRRWFRRGSASEAAGLYLDGGFGVGKTHLLAGLWHQAPGPKLFATFVELTHLVGALGFAEAVERLAAYRVVCIDEFELDDPGDTVLVSTLLTRLAERGVWLAATSNTLPDQLGEGRFAAEDFLREIQVLASRFDVVRIDGPDYRHRDLSHPAEPYNDAALRELAVGEPAASYDHFVDLCRHLEEVHPSRFGRLVDGVGLACIEDVRTLTDQSTARRVVVLVDRLYDRGVPVAASGVPLDRVFGPDMLTGGYRKKYQRAISRLIALSWARGVTGPRQE
jgi:cell division protein ZapE